MFAKQTIETTLDEDNILDILTRRDARSYLAKPFILVAILFFTVFALIAFVSERIAGKPKS
jgi:ABC-type uncharacterized transport system permease subunit